MSTGRATTFDQLLESSRRGDHQTAVELLPQVYAELRQLAHAQMSSLPPGQTLQPTALVHEAFLRLAGSDRTNWHNRAYFFCAAARAMRHILVDQARRKNSLKRGGDRRRLGGNGEQVSAPSPTEQIIALDEALERLEMVDPRKAKIVMLRYFAGLSNEETGSALGVSTRTIEREWRFARALLHAQLSRPDLE